MSTNAAAQTPVLRTNHVNNSLLKRWEKNRISRLLQNIVGRDGVWVRHKANKIEISLRTQPIDKKVAVDDAATPDYMGNTGGTGVLRVDSTLDYTDGGDFVTLGVDESELNVGSMDGLTSITVVTDIRYDTSTHQIQKKTRTAKVVDPGAGSGWTMITGGQAGECDDTP